MIPTNINQAIIYTIKKNCQVNVAQFWNKANLSTEQ